MISFLNHNIIRLYELAQMWRELRDLRDRFEMADSTLANHVRNIGTEITGEYPGFNMEQVDDLREQVANGILKVLTEEIDRLSSPEFQQFKVERQKVRHGEPPTAATEVSSRPFHVSEGGPKARCPFDSMRGCLMGLPLDITDLKNQFHHVWGQAQERTYDKDQWRKLRTLINRVPGLENV